MARIIPMELNAEFLKAYNVETMTACDLSAIKIKVWDLYGTAPKDGEEIGAVGSYIAAVIYCETCDKSIELHRKQLASQERTG